MLLVKFFVCSEQESSFVFLIIPLMFSSFVWGCLETRNCWETSEHSCYRCIPSRAWYWSSSLQETNSSLKSLDAGLHLIKRLTHLWSRCCLNVIKFMGFERTGFVPDGNSWPDHPHPPFLSLILSASLNALSRSLFSPAPSSTGTRAQTACCFCTGFVPNGSSWPDHR